MSDARINAPKQKQKVPNKKSIPHSSPKQLRNPTVKKQGSTDTINVVMNSGDWIFFQNSALSSVPVEDDGHTIAEGYDQYINDNFNTWINEHLEKYYPSFVGGHVFLNHNQDEIQSFGFLAGAKLRKIVSKERGNHRFVVELLMAINTKAAPDKNVVKSIIKNGEFYTSMGCAAASVMCSQCGVISTEDDGSDSCAHLVYDLGDKYRTKYGHISRVAEIITPYNSQKKDIEEFNSEDLDSYPVHFYENTIIWDEDPAYKGVVNSYMIKVPTSELMSNKIVLELPKRVLTRSTFNGIKYWQEKGFLEIK
jgi:hypothetical protein